ncbi:NADH dehydrogenase 1 alpha subcomplex subunit 2 [Caerostris darwini]|uniref:NADH dehydrogenase [ubiquinone] 1 alpha subcomplex subunit 2 n=1 Tax=Caerostris darwini TaxID=1538125 RepID=A0AAV4RCB6_9ARAC|nr:NADH dehydrogenase 1 alpha subcomplex subunit 2 [Caerostris darwini]
MTSKAIKLGSYLKEIRIHLCQKSNSSSGIREFIQKHYVPIKKQNPKFPLLIRECENVEPRIYARYDFGKETSISLSNNKSEDVLEIIKKLTNMPSK